MTWDELAAIIPSLPPERRSEPVTIMPDPALPPLIFVGVDTADDEGDPPTLIVAKGS